MARTALANATSAAEDADIPALTAEVETASVLLDAPAARLIARGEERMILLEDVETLLASDALVVDACRNVVWNDGAAVSLATRPVLFALARTMAEAWPAEAARELLLTRAFHAKHADDSHRARLRVEISRLRAELASQADVDATERGFTLSPHTANEVVVLVPPADEEHGDVLALLADGESWASSALAIALDTSPRTVQRALDALASAGKVQPVGDGRARRWMTPPVLGFPTTLLLPGPLPSG